MPLLDKPATTLPPTFTAHIFTGLSRYEAKCKATGLSPYADYSRFMQIVQAMITVKKQQPNERIS